MGREDKNTLKNAQISKQVHVVNSENFPMAVSWSLGKTALERRNDELGLQADSDVIPYKITDPIRLLSQMQKYFSQLQRLDGLDPATDVKILNIVFSESTEIIPTKCLKTKFKPPRAEVALTNASTLSKFLNYYR